MALPKGRTNNPNGRPKAGRALTEILAREFNKSVDDGQGGRVAAKRFVAAKVRELLTTGKAELPGGATLRVSPHDYLEMVKWLYTQVDGTKASIAEDTRMVVEFGYADDEIAADFAAPASDAAAGDTGGEKI